MTSDDCDVLTSLTTPILWLKHLGFLQELEDRLLAIVLIIMIASHHLPPTNQTILPHKGDLRNATINVSIMGSEAEQKTAMAGLKSATGYLQAKVANRLQTRFTPVLAFKLDDSVKKSVAISRLIDEALADEQAPALQDEDEREAGDDDDAPEDKEDGDETGHTKGGPEHR